MTDVKRIKRAASISLGVIVLLFLPLLLLILAGTHGILIALLQGDAEFGDSLNGYVYLNAAFLAATFIPSFVLVAALGLAVGLLSAIKAEETPFQHKNVKRLKTIALLLILFEPLSFILGLIHLRFSPIAADLFDGPAWLAYMNFSGIVLMAGLIIYCVSLVLQYGVSLQTQVDETL